MLITFQPPLLREGQTHKGPDYYMSSQSGHAPVIHRSKDGHKTYIVCHDGDLQEAIERNRQSDQRMATSRTGRRIHFYTQRDAAESRYRAMCEAQVEVNRQMHQRYTTAPRKRTARLGVSAC